MPLGSNQHMRVVTVGKLGPVGPAGAGGGSFLYQQGAVSDTWVINHNLNFLPNVSVFDSADSEVEGNVVHNSVNSLTITFSAAFSGYATLS